jgi:hypothetical protein
MIKNGKDDSDMAVPRRLVYVEARIDLRRPGVQI